MARLNNFRRNSSLPDFITNVINFPVTMLKTDLIVFLPVITAILDNKQNLILFLTGGIKENLLKSRQTKGIKALVG